KRSNASVHKGVIMSLDRRSTRLASLTLLAALTVAVVATTAASAPAPKPKPAVWTTAEIGKKLPTRHITLIWNVPKKLPKAYNLGFVNWAVSYPFFNEWSQGMKAASKLFGVNFYEADSAWDS